MGSVRELFKRLGVIFSAVSLLQRRLRIQKLFTVLDGRYNMYRCPPVKSSPCCVCCVRSDANKRVMKGANDQGIDLPTSIFLSEKC